MGGQGSKKVVSMKEIIKNSELYFKFIQRSILSEHARKVIAHPPCTNHNAIYTGDHAMANAILPQSALFYPQGKNHLLEH